MLHLITGPPAAGKTTWMNQHAKPGDITIDWDALTAALTPGGGDLHSTPRHVQAVVKAARQAAIDTAITMATDHDVYLIHATPSPTLLSHYQSAGARIITIDPGRDIVLARCKAERPWQMTQAAKQWYTNRQQTPDHGQQTRETAMTWVKTAINTLTRHDPTRPRGITAGQSPAPQNIEGGPQPDPRAPRQDFFSDREIL